jgi:hypothetical protein
MDRHSLDIDPNLNLRYFPMSYTEYATVVVSTQSLKKWNDMLSRERENGGKSCWLMPDKMRTRR